MEKIKPFTGKQRMLNAYRGLPNDTTAVAPEFWYYYPAKVLGVDMIEFQKNVPFHRALLETFRKFNCEGWGAAFFNIPNDRVSFKSTERRLDENAFEITTIQTTPAGELTSISRISKNEPGWSVKQPVEDISRDLPAWEESAFGGEPENIDVTAMIRAWEEVGGIYLLEAWLGAPFFDFFAGSRQGGFETGIYDFLNPDMIPTLERLQAKYLDRLVRIVRVICERTPFESFCIGCAWSCNSLLGPALWRQWDKPVIKAVADEIHRHGKLLHVHFHGKSMETAADFAEMGLDCVCPFERPPGGDVEGLEELREVEKFLRGRTTMNGNVHTVNTLIRGTTADVRREVAEIREAFAGNPRVIVGTGDQVGRETPEENLFAMIEAARSPL